MKFWWKGKAHRKTEAEEVRFGLRFLYFAAGRENNQLEHFSDDRTATPPTEQGFLEFKESKTRLLHTMLAPAPDGAFGPVPRGVAVGRPRRACAYGEQTGHHGKGKNKRKQFSFHRFFFPSENLFLRLPAVGSQGQFCPRQGNFLAYHTEDTQKSNLLAAHHLPEIPRS